MYFHSQEAIFWNPVDQVVYLWQAADFGSCGFLCEGVRKFPEVCFRLLRALLTKFPGSVRNIYFIPTTESMIQY